MKTLTTLLWAKNATQPLFNWWVTWTSSRKKELKVKEGEWQSQTTSPSYPAFVALIWRSRKQAGVHCSSEGYTASHLKEAIMNCLEMDNPSNYVYFSYADPSVKNTARSSVNWGPHRSMKLHAGFPPAASCSIHGLLAMDPSKLRKPTSHQ